jgi:hypothetical protein
VFSEINEDNSAKVKFAQCNNCGIVHKVTDICKSTIVQNKESMPSMLSIDDLKHSLGPNVISVLENAGADLASWEAAQFITENKNWGDFIVLSSESEDNIKQIKYVRILGENLVKVETYTKEEQ